MVKQKHTTLTSDFFASSNLGHAVRGCRTENFFGRLASISCDNVKVFVFSTNEKQLWKQSN